MENDDNDNKLWSPMKISPIEKLVPVPPSIRKSSGSKYPFASMEPGDSFVVEGDQRVLRNARSAASEFGQRKNMVFVTRIAGNAIRIWRVE